MNIQFKGVEEFRALVRRAGGADFVQRLKKAMNDSVAQWQTEAKMRVPVDTGLTRNTILKEVKVLGGGKMEAAVGSNQKHAPFIEFGTAEIAGGQVKALGTGPEITDAQAVHTWAAKQRDANDRTSFGVDPDGNLTDAGGNPLSGSRSLAGQQEQMPWLRPAFMAIRKAVIKRLQGALQIK